MDSAMLIDRAENATGLLNYLERAAPELAGMRVFTRQDLAADPAGTGSTRYLFGTWNMPTLSEQEIEGSLPALEAIFYAAGDTRYFAQPFAARGVDIFAAQNENSIPVAEFVVAQALLANKGYFQAHDAYRRGFWRFGFNRARALSRQKPGNFGATIGIIGLGTIGSLVADRLKPFEISVLVHDPFVDADAVAAAGAVRAGLEEIFEKADVVTNHLPDTEATRGMLGYRHFAAMKAHATFINTGRGQQVDEKGLAKAMRECPTKTALLDVTRREPPDPHSPLNRARNIFLSPHIAGSQGQEVERLYEAALRQFRDHVAGRGSAE